MSFSTYRGPLALVLDDGPELDVFGEVLLDQGEVNVGSQLTDDWSPGLYAWQVNVRDNRPPGAQSFPRPRLEHLTLRLPDGRKAPGITGTVRLQVGEPVWQVIDGMGKVITLLPVLADA